MFAAADNFAAAAGNCWFAGNQCFRRQFAAAVAADNRRLAGNRLADADNRLVYFGRCCG